MDDGLIKVIHSSAFDTSTDVGMRVVEDPAQLTKSASTIFECEYDDIRPDKDHVGIHVVALGDFERFGSNRNGDSFPKKACANYHPTFVKHGCLYRHHRNKDPEKRLGQIVKSAYDESMGRVELFVHANKENARDELHRLDTDGEVPFSMACKVAFDRCNQCGTLRRNSQDPDQCEHVQPGQLGKMAEDGSINCTHNDEPNFFDISFVGRPADRIAWDVMKIAADKGDVVSSIKLAEVEGVWVPDHLAITSPEANVKLAHLKKLAEFSDMYTKMSETGPSTSVEHYMWELRKAGAATLDDDTIEKLRQYEPDDVFFGLAKVGVVLDAASFYKYAMGLDYGAIYPHIDGTLRAVPGIYSRLVKGAECQNVCNDQLFDVNAQSHILDRVPNDLLNKIADDQAFVGPGVEERVIARTVQQDILNMTLDSNTKIGFNTNSTMELLATKYAAYKLSALNAVLSLNDGGDTDELFAVAAAQDLFNV